MAKQNYVGFGDPIVAFKKLEPYVHQLQLMQQKCKPFGRDYHAIAIALEALDSTAYHFTRRPHFYAGLPHG